MADTSAAFDIVAAEPGRMTAANCVVQVDVIGDLTAAEPIWRGLERDGAVATPYQRYDWVAPWQRHIGTRAGITPFLVVGRDSAGKPAFLWPLGRQKSGPLTVARFLGGKHANFNFALWRRDVVGGFGIGDLELVLSRIAALRTGIDLLQLFNQPERWDRFTNPLLALSHQPSPSFGYRGTLEADFATLLNARMSPVTRRKIRRKERRLGEHGPLRCWRIDTAGDAQKVLGAFFTQKTERMQELGIADVFAAPGVQDFITEACLAKLADRTPAIELYALAAGDTIVATFAGCAGGGRFSCMFNSIIRNELARESPGEQLLVGLVQMCCARGITTFDLGVGEASYKQQFCEDIEPLFDSFVPLTALGHVAAAASRLTFAVKRQIKHSPAIWSTTQALRRRLGWRRSATETAP